MLEIGIDLGTSNSLIGYFDPETGESKLITNRFGHVLTPSVVSVDEQNNVIVGEIAKARRITNPTETVSAFKRFMGSEMVYLCGKKSFTPIELSSFVLSALKKDAEDFLNEKIDQVVISVPAYFNAFQREATISAAKLAGLTVRQLISEPTAAAIAYGLENTEADQSFMIVDLGGGTFDVSLISLFEQVVQVEAIGGDTQLGGEDFTFALIDAALKKADLTRDAADKVLLSELYDKAEKMKKKFSNPLNLSAEFTFEYQDQTINFQLTIVEFRELVMPLLAKFQRPTQRVMTDSNMHFSELDKLILVGGASRLPLIHQTFEKITGLKAQNDLNPDEAIALGAITRAHMLNDKSRQELIMTDVIGFSLGTGVHNPEDPSHSIFSPIIERNTVIPASRELRVRKISPAQRNVRISIYQGENPYTKDNLKLGEINYPVALLERSDTITVRFTYDESGVLEVEVTDDKQKHHKNLVIQNRQIKLSDSELEKLRKKVAHLKINPLEQDDNQLILARFAQFYQEFIGERRQMVLREQQYFVSQLNSGNPRRVHQAQERAAEFFEMLETLL